MLSIMAVRSKGVVKLLSLASKGSRVCVESVPAMRARTGRGGRRQREIGKGGGGGAGGGGVSGGGWGANELE